MIRSYFTAPNLRLKTPALTLVVRPLTSAEVCWFPSRLRYFTAVLRLLVAELSGRFPHRLATAGVCGFRLFWHGGWHAGLSTSTVSLGTGLSCPGNLVIRINRLKPVRASDRQRPPQRVLSGTRAIRLVTSLGNNVSAVHVTATTVPPMITTRVMGSRLGS